MFGFGCALVALALLAIFGAHRWALVLMLSGVGAIMMAAVPTVQVRLTRFSPEAATPMGAMNLASLNIGNAIGVGAGGIAVAGGWALVSAVWAGFILTCVGLVVFIVTLPRAQQTVAV